MKTSHYYKYDFVSPQPLFAIVKEELKSYFDTGAIDDLMFPIYLEKCLKKLRKGSYKILNTILNIKDYQARLPDGYHAVREAWMCTWYNESYQLPNADYQTLSVSTKLDDPDVSCDLCEECALPGIVRAMYKTTNTVIFQVQRQFLLTPGNISLEKNLGLGCANTNPLNKEHMCEATFDVRGNKFTTSFQEGVVHLVYYAKEYDESGYQLVPDSYDIWEYIEAYLKYKMYEQLYNQVTDESSRQIREKVAYYEAKQDEKFILARTETMKETVYGIQRAIRKNNNRLNKFIII